MGERSLSCRLASATPQIRRQCQANGKGLSWWLAVGAAHARRWGGPQCDDAVCRDCANGVCTAPEQCKCSHGWTGAECLDAVCRGHAACGPHGTCVAPNRCRCDAGWAGRQCTVPCTHGHYVPEKLKPSRATPANAPAADAGEAGVCECERGWGGVACDHAHCPSHGCVNGVCKYVPSISSVLCFRRSFHVSRPSLRNLRFRGLCYGAPTLSLSHTHTPQHVSGSPLQVLLQ
jgi:hypothetical protein